MLARTWTFQGGWVIGEVAAPSQPVLTLKSSATCMKLCVGKELGTLVRHPGHHGQLLKVGVRIHGGGSSQHLPDPNAHLWDILTSSLVGAGQAVGISTILLPLGCFRHTCRQAHASVCHPCSGLHHTPLGDEPCLTMGLRPGFVSSRLNSPHAQGVWVAALPLALGALWAERPHAVFLRVSVTHLCSSSFLAFLHRV